MADWTRRFSLGRRKALVTGASSGIGAKICEIFADAGADIVAVAADHVPRALHKVVSSRSIASGHRPNIRALAAI